MDNSTSYSFRKTYTLLAQTPLIHFQHAQDGAVLRPSEVKPKLDKYLRCVAGGIPESWTIPGQTALNYKLQVCAAGEHPERGQINVADCKAYFGNQGDAAPKDLVFRNCTLTVLCFIPELLQLIDEKIGDFFTLENFGCRQSKGFGGFLVQGRSDANTVDRTLRAACPYLFYADFASSDGIVERLNHAMVVYACMKNGFKMGKKPPFYGYVTNGYIPGDIGNDQQFIRDCVVNGKPAAYDSYQFVRAVLGLADRYDFRQKGVVQVLHFQGTQQEGGRLHIPLESIQKGLGIKRFRSPIQIKIFKSRMYFLFWDDCSSILGQTFLLMKEQEWKTFSKIIKDGQLELAQQRLQQAKYISTPEMFDRQWFMSDFVDYFHEERDVIRGFPRAWRPSAQLELKKGDC